MLSKTGHAAVPITVAPAAEPDTDRFPIRLEGVSKRYQKNGLLALNGIDLFVRKGEICGVIGRSGAGKSTLIRLINRLEEPTSGKVVVGGVDIGMLAEKELVRLRRRIGMIFQHFNLLSASTVWDNVALPLRVANVPAAQIRERTAELLNLVGLEDRHKAYPAQLSGGQKQRVGIARALVHNPEILLCDEATSSLDPETTESILALIQAISRKLGLTIVFITHEMSVVRAISDRVVVLEKGQIVEAGETSAVFLSPQHEVTKALLASLEHKLPKDFTQSLASAPPDAGLFELVLDLDFHEGTAPDLTAIVDALKINIKIVHASVDQIKGKYRGRIVLSCEVAAADAPSVIARAEALHAQVTVLGYRVNS